MSLVQFNDDFYGFPEVPFHVHLGMTFTRPEPGGPAVVGLPARPEAVTGDDRQSLSAVYAVGEVSSGVAMCDALDIGDQAGESRLTPLALTREVRFRPGGQARGELRSETRVVGDAGEAIERLKRSRKTNIEVEARILDGDGEVAGEMTVLFYIRLMDHSRLEAMAGSLTPTLALGRDL